jgi:tetratricopeptide (TPR) repeat protein
MEIDDEAVSALNHAGSAVAEGGLAAKGGIDSMEALSRRYPRSARVRNALHTTYLSRQDWTAAAAVFERFDPALLTEPERLHLGRVHVRAGNPARALEWLMPLLRSAPEDPARAVSAACALYALGRIDEALRVLDQAWPALRDGRDPEAWRVRGLALLRTGDPDGAIAHLDALVRQFPDYAPGHYALARACASTGQSARAAEHMRRFEALSEATHERMRRQMYLSGRSFDVRAAREAGRHEEAIETVGEMIELADATLEFDLRMLLADVYDEAGRSQEARLAREEAARRQAGSP